MKQPGGKSTTDVDTRSPDNEIDERTHYHDKNQDDESGDGWFRQYGDYEARRLKKMPVLFQCVCGEKWCSEAILYRYRRLGFIIPLRMVSRHDYRERLTQVFEIPERRLHKKKFAINIHHYTLDQRQTAYQRGDKQFTNDGVRYILPSQSKEDVISEIDAARAILKHEPEKYREKVLPALLGKGDGKLTKQDLISMAGDYKNHQATGEDQRSKTCEESNQLNKLMEDPTKYGSKLLENILLVMNGEGEMTAAATIEKDEYLYSHLEAEDDLDSKRERYQSGLVEALIPHSIASRRASRRPAVKNSPKDITLIIPTDVDKVMECMIPINEAKKKSGRRNYADEHYMNRTWVHETFICQGREFNEYRLLKCHDKNNELTVYVDADGGLPKLSTEGSRSQWTHAHYFRVKDVLTVGEVKSAFKLCREYNMQYLPPVLILMCQMKAKKGCEDKEEFKLEDWIEKMSTDKLVLDSISEFEIFFERLLQVFLLNLQRVRISNMTRLTWASWNVWRHDLDCNFIYEEKENRSTTRRLYKNNSESPNEMNVLVHYITILLHTQGL